VGQGHAGQQITIPRDTIPPHQRLVHETLFNKNAVGV
jgi:hypothetical protein